MHSATLACDDQRVVSRREAGLEMWLIIRNPIDLEPGVPAEVHMLGRDVRLGAVRRDAHRTDATCDVGEIRGQADHG